MPTLTLKTPAKINLFLNIRGQRPDGYHEVCMVLQTVALFDTLTIEPSLERPDIMLTILQNEQGRLLRHEHAEQNLVVKAYRQFWNFVQLPPLGLQVTLDKQIPVQAGLGGGSSDAAAMLLALNHLSHARLELRELQQIASGLGSDVPFFLGGGVALATGRGELIEPLMLDAREAQSVRKAWVIIKPRSFGIPTPQAYQSVRQAGRYRDQTPEHLIMALRKSIKRTFSTDELESYLLNDFEPVLFSQYPALREMAHTMQTIGVRRPLLCGSGPSMVGLLPLTMQHQRLIRQAFPDSEYQVFWTYPHWGGPVQPPIQTDTAISARP